MSSRTMNTDITMLSDTYINVCMKVLGELIPLTYFQKLIFKE